MSLLYGMKSASDLGNNWLLLLIYSLVFSRKILCKGIKNLDCFGDCQLLIKHLNGELTQKGSKLGHYLAEV